MEASSLFILILKIFPRNIGKYASTCKRRKSLFRLDWLLLAHPDLEISIKIPKTLIYQLSIDFRINR